MEVTSLENLNLTGYLHFIMGPMMSEKSTKLLSELIRYATIPKDNPRKVIYINTALDVRQAAVFTTHNELLRKVQECKNIQWTRTQTLSSISDEELLNCDVIGIDETHFYPDLIVNVKRWLKMGKIIICAGLSGSSDLTGIGENLRLIPLADDVTHCKAVCEYCLNEGTEINHFPDDKPPAPFSVRLVHSDSILLNGGAEKFTVACRRHHQEHNIPVESQDSQVELEMHFSAATTPLDLRSSVDTFTVDFGHDIV